MAFVKSTPNLSDDEKARIEFHLQQIAECVGFDRLALPVLGENSLLPEKPQTADQLMRLVGEHLGHDVSGVKIQTFPMQPGKIGGGG